MKSTIKSTEKTFWNVLRHFNVRLAIKKRTHMPYGASACDSDVKMAEF